MKLLTVLICILLTHANLANCQSITFELGASKHFIAESDKYEQPNLHFQVRHNASKRIEYFVSYYSIKQYWQSEYHDIDQFKDEPEIQSRNIKGVDFSINVLPLFTKLNDAKFTLDIGSTFRFRQEDIVYECHYTLDGWPECLGYITNAYDVGASCMLDLDYLLWNNIGLSINSVFRVYNKSVPSLSFNGGIIYKFDYSNSKKE